MNTSTKKRLKNNKIIVLLSLASLAYRLRKMSPAKDPINIIFLESPRVKILIDEAYKLASTRARNLKSS